MRDRAPGETTTICVSPRVIRIPNHGSRARKFIGRHNNTADRYQQLRGVRIPWQRYDKASLTGYRKTNLTTALNYRNAGPTELTS